MLQRITVSDDAQDLTGNESVIYYGNITTTILELIIFE